MNSSEELSALGICTQRFNMDRVSNNNGRRLVELCRSLDMHIVNGRCGSDQGVGNFTFADKSTIDYVIVSPEIFPNIVSFDIDAFDNLMSDNHNPIQVEIRGYPKDPASCTTVAVACGLEAASNTTLTKILWDNGKRHDFENSFDMDNIHKFLYDIDLINVTNVSQEQIDCLSSNVKKLFLDTAERAGLIRESSIKQRKVAKSPIKKWFNNDCKLARSRYIKSKQG